MAFKKGQSGNPKGKPRGAKNKATIEFKEALNNLLNHAAPHMIKWLDELDDPMKRFTVLKDFAEYIHPKLARTEHTGDEDNPIETLSKVQFEVLKPKEKK